MTLLADLAIIIFLLIFALNGYRRGFLILAGRLLILGASVALSLLLLGPTAKILNDLPFMQPLVNALNEKVIHPLLPVAGTVTDSLLALAIPAPIRELILGRFPDVQSPISEAWPVLSNQLTQYAITVTVFLILLTVISIVLQTVITVISGALDRVPVVGWLNHLTGLVLGLIHGSLIVAIILLTIGLLAPYIPWLAEIQRQSMIFDYIYRQDLIARGFAFIFQQI